MRITVLAVGSRGDVQPVLALALALQQAGHVVRLGTHDVFRPLAESHGMDIHVLRGLSIDDLMHTMTAGGGQRRGGRFFGEFFRGMGLIREGMEDLQDSCLEASENAELLCTSPQLFAFAASLAETGGPVQACLSLQPMAPTGQFPSPFMGTRSLGPWLNRMSYTAPAHLFWPFVSRTFNHWRDTRLGLGPVGASTAARWLKFQRDLFCGFSEHVVPRPPDWSSHVQTCGYWRLVSDGWCPSVELERFLAAGPPPLAIGFGSMADGEAERTLSTVLEALELSGRRAVIQTSLSGTEGRGLPETVHRADDLPHDWLFPRCAAVVHHAGAGTAGETMRAGIPSIPVPWAFEQPWWARRMQQLGVATAPLPRHRLTAQALAQRITQACDDASLRMRARNLGHALQAEDGLACAVSRLERLVESRQARGLG